MRKPLRACILLWMAWGELVQRRTWRHARQPREGHATVEGIEKFDGFCAASVCADCGGAWVPVGEGWVRCLACGFQGARRAEDDAGGLR